MTIVVAKQSASTHTKSSAIYLQGEICQGMFIVLHGVVALATGNSPNRQVRVTLCREGCVLGLAETIVGGAYQSKAVAVTDVTTEFMARTDVLNAIASDPTTGFQFLQMLAAQLEELCRRIKGMGAARTSRSKARKL